ncbi:hypothetical protein DAPPUDRAFT_305656 [Daphnia pulex]|uniref:Uncharacterized protein n=1 Tax=Daphnia pulex TaxID=6669 RepID=E9FX58_DAPPU|nr:hypothetical protein DAPPUDRAFT_305656 [Daphnia pulex]|eukprot:EFX88322.1 hypothetical protein DAPPUDRAFT_305656 [Daphnia pulex]
MSWLTDLAGKAEDFLVKIDKNAAAVAAQTVLVTKDRVTPSHSRRDSGASIASVASDFSNNHAPQNSSTAANFKNSVSMSDLSKAGKSKLDLDATLMASLNANSDVLDASSVSTAPNSTSYSNGLGGNDLTLVQENNLLKQEIKSINQEIRQSMQHAKQAQKEAKNAEQQLKSQIAVVQSVEQRVSVLRKENMTLADQLLDKDAELSTLKSKVEAIHVEQEYQTKLEHMQAQLETEVKKRQSLEVETKVQFNQLEKERCILMGESQQYQHQLQTVKEELESTHQSFNEYKLRAQRILQDKDRLLQDIKEHKTVESFQLPNELLMAELDQLQQERDLLREETAQSNSQLQQCRMEIAHLEARYEEEIRQIRELNNQAETRLLEERSKKELIENELRQLDEELRYVREDLSQQKVQSVGRIQQLETELNKVRNQLTSKQNNSSTPSQDEFEQRLRTLTETLVAKQAVLEAVQSERSSLLLQLERANKERSGIPSETENSTRVLLNITDDELAKVTTGVSRRMRHAYSSLDSLNFRFGQALRRRPAARLVLFFYMVVLHFWVAFVLLTYTPEMHENHTTSL